MLAEGDGASLDLELLFVLLAAHSEPVAGVLVTSLFLCSRDGDQLSKQVCGVRIGGSRFFFLAFAARPARFLRTYMYALLLEYFSSMRRSV